MILISNKSLESTVIFVAKKENSSVADALMWPIVNLIIKKLTGPRIEWSVSVSRIKSKCITKKNMESAQKFSNYSLMVGIFKLLNHLTNCLKKKKNFVKPVPAFTINSSTVPQWFYWPAFGFTTRTSIKPWTC